MWTNVLGTATPDDKYGQADVSSFLQWLLIE